MEPDWLPDLLLANEQSTTVQPIAEDFMMEDQHAPVFTAWSPVPFLSVQPAAEDHVMDNHHATVSTAWSHVPFFSVQPMAPEHSLGEGHSATQHRSTFDFSLL